MLMRRRNVDFCTGSVIGDFVRFAIPLFLSSLLHILFNTADVVVVGQFVGDAAQAAVSSTTTIIAAMICLVSGLGAGVNVLVAQSVGSGDNRRTGQVVHTAMAAALLLGSVLAVVCILLVPAVLGLMGFPADVYEHAVVYLRIYMLGIPLELFHDFGAAVLRAQGDSRRPMYYLIICGAINLVVNVILVCGFGLGAGGAAAATVLSYLISALLIGRCLTQESGPAHLDVRRMHIHLPTLGRVAAIGVPAGLQSMMFSLSTMILQTYVNSMGTAVVAGAGAATNLVQYVNLIGGTSFTVCITFAGQNLGGGHPERIRKGLGQILLLLAGVCAVVSVALLLGGPLLLRLYTRDPVVVKCGMERLWAIVPFAILHAAMQTIQGIQRGLGASVAPMLVNLVCTCLLRVLWAMTVFPLCPTLFVLTLGYPVTWLIATVVQAIHLRWYMPRAFAKTKRAISANEV